MTRGETRVNTVLLNKEAIRVSCMVNNCWIR